MYIFCNIACPIDGRPINEVFVDEVKMDVVPSFCYLGDMLSDTFSAPLLA